MSQDVKSISRTPPTMCSSDITRLTESEASMNSLEKCSKREKLLKLHGELTKKAHELMVVKNHDYAASDDPFRNFRTFGELGILVRMSDKVARLHSFVENKTLAVKDESVLDSCLDLINYSVLFIGYLEDGNKTT